MYRRSLWIFLYVFIGARFNISLSGAQSVKTWNKNTNFDNPRNWEKEVLPCANDRVIFPAASSVATYMPESFSVAEIVLPLNGELIFPENATLSLTGGQKEGSCDGRDILFKPSAEFWHDPSNWNITSDLAFPRISSRRNAAVPHAFQVPCLTDGVEFPTKASFRVHHDYAKPTFITTAKINEIELNDTQFQRLLQTPTGKLLFPDNPEIHLTAGHCEDKSGCVCGNDNPQVLPTICMFEVPCPVLECSDPIELTGHCCPMCGSKITMNYKRDFKIEDLSKLYERFLEKIEYWQVESFTSKTHDGTIQSVFVDGSRKKGLASRVSKLIHDALIADVKGFGSYKVHSVEFHRSVLWGPNDQLPGSGMSSGGIAAIVILIMLLLGIAVAVYIYRKRQIPGFSFARFDLGSEKIELELDTTPHDDLQPVDPPAPAEPEPEPEPNSSKAFDNPVYGTEIASKDPEDSHEESVEERDFVENPMFMIFEDPTDKKESKYPSFK